MAMRRLSLLGICIFLFFPLSDSDAGEEKSKEQGGYQIILESGDIIRTNHRWNEDKKRIGYFYGGGIRYIAKEEVDSIGLTQSATLKGNPQKQKIEKTSDKKATEGVSKNAAKETSKEQGGYQIICKGGDIIRTNYIWNEDEKRIGYFYGGGIRYIAMEEVDFYRVTF